MNPAILENLAKEVKDLGCEIKLFHLCDPLLHPDLGKWIARFKAGKDSSGYLHDHLQDPEYHKDPNKTNYQC